MFDFQIIDDIKSIGVKDLFDAYAVVNQQNINKGIAKSQNYLNELNAQAELYRAKALAQTQQIGTLAKDNRLITAAVLLGIGFIAYKLIK